MKQIITILFLTFSHSLFSQDLQLEKNSNWKKYKKIIETNFENNTIIEYSLEYGKIKSIKHYSNDSPTETKLIEENKIFEYDDNSTGNFLPKKVVGNSNGRTFTYTTLYDNYYRIRGKIEQTPDFTYSSNTTFDSYGRTDVFTVITILNNPNYATSSSTKNIYDSNGILILQNDNFSGNKIWQVTSSNAYGKSVQVEYGNG